MKLYGRRKEFMWCKLHGVWELRYFSISVIPKLFFKLAQFTSYKHNIK